MPYRVEVDWNLCESNAVCMGLAPAVFRVGEDDELEILQETPPDDLRPAVEAAVQQCPKAAISIVDA